MQCATKEENGRDLEFGIEERERETVERKFCGQNRKLRMVDQIGESIVCCCVAGIVL